ncbi:hypothetical protein ACFSRY_09985 [Pontibacter locisalis]|uniref:Uncharacterized protein n=1 Tax=Pontibacter locisalis TaxID=1719035 RepID=A0ABW5IKP2_9BACT
MKLSEAMKVVLHYRQVPMTAPQIAYFLCSNKIILTDQYNELIQHVEEEALYSPAHFTVSEDFIQLSPWDERERQLIQKVFLVIQTAVNLTKVNNHESHLAHNQVLALLLYKRLSDIKRSQQHGTPIVPPQLKFNYVLATTLPADLPSKLHGVMEYIECTDERLDGIFSICRQELINVCEEYKVVQIYRAMGELSVLLLDEDNLPTPLFQVIFSRLFTINVKQTSKMLN